MSGLTVASEKGFVMQAAGIALLFFAASHGLLACADREAEHEYDQVVSDLTSEQLQQLCQETRGELDEEDLIQRDCTVDAVFRSDSEGLDCSALLDECMMETTSYPKPCESMPALPDCASMVSVGELEDCYLASAARVVELVGEISCDTAPETLGQKLDQPIAECQGLLESCPALFVQD